MEPFILPLEHVGDEDGRLVGEKALHLSQLRRAGMRVPEGFCITTAAYRLCLKGLEPRLEALFAQPELEWEEVVRLQQEMRALPIPESLRSAIEKGCREMGQQPVAIRSSATNEDLPVASFAGQYDTYLNVIGWEEVVDKVKACWASLLNRGLLSYLHRYHLSPLEVGLGVLVQKQVPAEVSGVLFTLNPFTGLEEEMLVEAHWGLGEAVVSGRVTPDRFLIDIGKEEVRSREVNEKRVMVVPGHPSGVREEEVPREKRGLSTLTDQQLLQLMELGLEIQGLYGYPQDIEWALFEGEFYILQTRPLTSYTFAPEIGQWTSANFREVMPGFITPLSFSMNGQYEWGKSLEEVFQRMKMMQKKRPVEWGRLFFGHAYWNVGEVKRLTSIIPGFKERAFDESVGVEPTYEGDGLVTPTTPATIIRALPILFALQGFYKGFWKEAQAYKEAFEKEEAEYSKVDLTALSGSELAEHVRGMIDFHWRTNRVALITSFLATQAQDDFTPTVEGLNARNPDGEPISTARLLTGLIEVGTGRPIRELWKIGREALRDNRVALTILEAEPSELPERLKSFPEGCDFWKRLEGYISEFRHMSERDEDLSQPRWDEDPTFAFVTLRSFLQAGCGTDPEELIAHQKEVRLQEERRAEALLSKNWVDRLFRKGQFFAQLETLRRYCWWRENTRPMLSLAHYHCHKVSVEQGKRWAASGYLEEAEDIFCLTRDMVLSALEGRLSLEEARARVRRYKRMKRCYRNFKPPPTIGRGARVPEVLPGATGQQIFTGVGCSAGQVTARAKVVRGLGEADKLKKGEILVAPHTNPGWVPLFNLAAGIVTEEGGLISHGAIVAREYGIPTVLQIREATKIFRDDQMLHVDGDRGVVEVVEA